jgi:solute carrier family 13 (sodium-dependent dicarboxylate transporter), member 2/3/5
MIALTNPGYLKLELAARGVRLDESARANPDVRRPSPIEGGADCGVEIVLPDEVWVSAAVDAGGNGDSPFLLSGRGDQGVLRCNGSALAVRVVPSPRFYRLTTSSGLPMHTVGTTYGGCIAINPTFACGYALRGAPCRFCRTGSGVAVSDGFPLSVQDVVEVVRAAFAEGAVEFVYFNLAYVGSEDAGMAFLEPYIRAVKRHFDTLVAVQIHPPKTNRWIDRTYAMGVDAVSYAVEVYDPEVLARRCPGRARFIGAERYYEALQYAATIFPSGTVWSDLVVGLEPPDSTRRGIDALVKNGVLPVLSLYRPPADKTARDQSMLSIDDVAPVCAHLYHAVRDARINMGWVRDLSFAMTPLEARFFAGDDARVAVALQHFYRSKVGNAAARSLARLRRQLRVRTVSDSFDSSHL